MTSLTFQYWCILISCKDGFFKMIQSDDTVVYFCVGERLVRPKPVELLLVLLPDH